MQKNMGNKKYMNAVIFINNFCVDNTYSHNYYNMLLQIAYKNSLGVEYDHLYFKYQWDYDDELINYQACIKALIKYINKKWSISQEEKDDITKKLLEDEQITMDELNNIKDLDINFYISY